MTAVPPPIRAIVDQNRDRTGGGAATVAGRPVGDPSCRAVGGRHRAGLAG